MLKLVDHHIASTPLHVLDMTVRLANLLHEDEKFIQEIVMLGDVNKAVFGIEQKSGSVFLHIQLPRKGN